VFCQRFNPRRATKDTRGQINVGVQLGSIFVNPRDIVLADANGILSIHPEMAQEAVAWAAEIANKESDIKSQIRSGRTTFEILELSH
jgi:regulator of RNase E activity RraA